MTELPLYHPRWASCTFKPGGDIRAAMAAISASGSFMSCLVNEDGVLKGIVTDSDIRRAILGGARPEDPVASIVNTNPVIAHYREDTATLRRLAKRHEVREIPLIDDDHKLRDLFVTLTFDTRSKRLVRDVDQEALPNSMLILAGGLGMRLRSVVSDRPKPLAEVGGRPILETVISKAAACGIKHFYIAVNYMAEKIEQHLDAGGYEGVEFTILRENTRLGTAGAIGLIDAAKLEHPLLVGNADVLTNVPLEQLIAHHQMESADMTCAVRPHLVKVPFGVMEIEGDTIQAIREKPEYSYFVNAGLYVLEPAVCRRVPGDRFMDMPDLMDEVIRDRGRICPFLVHEYWEDIGEPAALQRANEQFVDVFGKDA